MTFSFAWWPRRFPKLVGAGTIAWDRQRGCVVDRPTPPLTPHTYPGILNRKKLCLSEKIERWRIAVRGQVAWGPRQVGIWDGGTLFHRATSTRRLWPRLLRRASIRGRLSRRQRCPLLLRRAASRGRQRRRRQRSGARSSLRRRRRPRRRGRARGRPPSSTLLSCRARSGVRAWRGG